MLEGKVAVVTGASRGIGKAIALAFAKEGATVIVNYNGSAAKAEAVVEEICQAGGQAEAVQCNVADFSACETFLADIVKRYKRIDILVNNAGITRDSLLIRMKEEDFKQVVDTNLGGTFNVTKNVISYMMKAHSGRIINISSVVGVAGNAGQTNYSASKAGIIGFTKSLAKASA